jgi:prepilin-type N-terminal cleavage/methylation domain-containing protein
MRFSTHKVSPANTGFTLIEVLVSVALFSIIAVLVVGAFMSVLDANRKARAERQVLDSTQSFIELMTREIRDTAGFTSSCMGTSCSFWTPDGSNEIAYRLNGTTVERRSCSSCPWEPMTDAGVQIDYLDFGDTPSGSGVVVSISGIAQAGTAQETDFDIETTVAPRRDNLGARDEFTRSIPSPASPGSGGAYETASSSAAPATEAVSTWSSDYVPSPDIRVPQSDIFCPWSGINIPADWVVVDIGHGKTNSEMPYQFWSDLVHSDDINPAGGARYLPYINLWLPPNPSNMGVSLMWLYRCNPLHQSVHMTSCNMGYDDPVVGSYTPPAGAPWPAQTIDRSSNAVARYEANANPGSATKQVSVTNAAGTFSTPNVTTATCQLAEHTVGGIVDAPGGVSLDPARDYDVYIATDDYDHCIAYDTATPPNCTTPCYELDPVTGYMVLISEDPAVCVAEIAAGNVDRTAHAPQGGEQVAIQLRDAGGTIIPWESGELISAVTDDIATEANGAITLVGKVGPTTGVPVSNISTVDVMMRSFREWVGFGAQQHNSIPTTFTYGGVPIPTNPNYRDYCYDGYEPFVAPAPGGLFASGASMGVGCIAFAPTPYPGSSGTGCDNPSWTNICPDGNTCSPAGTVCCPDGVGYPTYCNGTDVSVCKSGGTMCEEMVPGCDPGFVACGSGASATCIPAGTVCCAPEGHPDKYCDAGELCSPDGRCFTEPPNLQTPDTHLDINVEEF